MYSLTFSPKPKKLTVQPHLYSPTGPVPMYPMCTTRPALARTPMCDEVGGPFAQLHTCICGCPSFWQLQLSFSQKAVLAPPDLRWHCFLSHSVSSRSDPFRSLNKPPSARLEPLSLKPHQPTRRDLRNSKVPDPVPKGKRKSCGAQG